MKFPILLYVCAVAGAASAAGAACAQEIRWSAERPLTWADFKGPVARGTASVNVAMTAASLSWSYDYEYERSGTSCTYRITDIRAFAEFHPDQSWVRPGNERPAVLAHEQGHFDIAQIHKITFERQARPFAGVARPCEGRNERSISSFIEREIARRVGSIYEQVWREHTRMQDTYDADTNHGMNAAAQREWLDRIAARLRGEQRPR